MQPPNSNRFAALKYLSQASKSDAVSVSFLGKHLLSLVGLSALLLIPVAILAIAPDANACGKGGRSHRCTSRSGAVYYDRSSSCRPNCDRPRPHPRPCTTDCAPIRPLPEPRPLPPIRPIDPCEGFGCNSFIPPGPVNTGPFFSNRPVYVVLVPNDSGARLGEVRRYVPGAYQAEAIIGRYIRVASYTDRSAADDLATRLRWTGFDAQVRYLSRYF